LAAFLAFAASSLLIVCWFVFLWLLLIPATEPLGKAWPIVTALGLTGGLVLLLTAYIMKPATGIFLGLLITGFWVSDQASPEGGAIIPSALYSANLGGGRPAHIDQSRLIKGKFAT
jgi:hypothetical protein